MYFASSMKPFARLTYQQSGQCNDSVIIICQISFVFFATDFYTDVRTCVLHRSHGLLLQLDRYQHTRVRIGNASTTESVIRLVIYTYESVIRSFSIILVSHYHGASFATPGRYSRRGICDERTCDACSFALERHPRAHRANISSNATLDC